MYIYIIALIYILSSKFLYHVRCIFKLEARDDPYEKNQKYLIYVSERYLIYMIRDI